MALQSDSGARQPALHGSSSLSAVLKGSNGNITSSSGHVVGATRALAC